MATKIRRNEKLASSRLQQSNFPKLTPSKRPAKKNCMRISPCDRMMTKYWQNDYVDTQSKARCHLKCLEVIAGSHLEEPLSSLTSNPTNNPSADDTRCRKTSSNGSTATRLVNRFTWLKTDTGFRMKCNFGPIDECQGIIASVVVKKTGVTEYWFYRRGFLSTIHYKET
ncbi:PREDICTED: uncharacterized protein LOC107165504 isoform X2 [Diuraphis noxia]|uniref:uncharacterized protein LOC107165504 isoform X2 n=1 Tax=Diuraphis noxia TaxID=143948 RepID=UPI0007637D06|nr:PREDICTED: uncharacterized protein LOC107165504 isoform X2 [Diuraphis noxia]